MLEVSGTILFLKIKDYMPRKNIQDWNEVPRQNIARQSYKALIGYDR